MTLSLSCLRGPGLSKVVAFIFLLTPSPLIEPVPANARTEGRTFSTIMLRSVLAVRASSGSGGQVVSGQAVPAAPRRKSGPQAPVTNPRPPHPTWLEVSRSVPTAAQRSAAQLPAVRVTVASYSRRLAAMISASRAAASRLVGAAASRGPTVARHQVRNFQAFPEGLTAHGSRSWPLELQATRPSGSESSGRDQVGRKVTGLLQSALPIQGPFQVLSPCLELC